MSILRKIHAKGIFMCRNIKTLHNLTPQASNQDIEASALQYVRKLSGIKKPKGTEKETFDTAVEEVARATKKLLDTLAVPKAS